MDSTIHNPLPPQNARWRVLRPKTKVTDDQKLGKTLPPNFALTLVSIRDWLEIICIPPMLCPRVSNCCICGWPNLTKQSVYPMATWPWRRHNGIHCFSTYHSSWYISGSHHFQIKKIATTCCTNGGFLKQGYLLYIDWDFPWNTPSSYWGTPMTMETSIYSGWKKSCTSWHG